MMDNRLVEIAENLDKMLIGVDEPFKFHCDMCGKCCINREDILLNPMDIYNMSKKLGMKPEDMIGEYCESYIGSSSYIPLIRLKPRGSVRRCPLLKDRKCSVHDAKPAICAMFPIGRCVQKDEKEADFKMDTGDIQYIYINPRCGDDSETHTVREWLDKFGISLEDKFYVEWIQVIMELGSIFREGEKVLSERVMDEAWFATYVGLYLAYDTAKDFMPQFQKNAADIVGLMRNMPVGNAAVGKSSSNA